MYNNAEWVVENGNHIMIRVDIDGVASFVPIDPANTDYQNIMQLVEKGELVIAPAEETPAL